MQIFWLPPRLLFVLIFVLIFSTILLAQTDQNPRILSASPNLESTASRIEVSTKISCGQIEDKVALDQTQTDEELIQQLSSHNPQVASQAVREIIKRGYNGSLFTKA